MVGDKFVEGRVCPRCGDRLRISSKDLSVYCISCDYVEEDVDVTNEEMADQ